MFRLQGFLVPAQRRDRAHHRWHPDPSAPPSPGNSPLDPAEVRILSRDEAKQDDMRRWLNDLGLVSTSRRPRPPRIGCGCREQGRLRLPAADLKQVPRWNSFPQSSLRMCKADHVVRAAHECRIKSVVCLSTDKAVYPINAMGISEGRPTGGWSTTAR